MKIAFVSSGNSIHVKKLANGLTENGHSVTLYTLPNHNRLLSDFDSGVKIVPLKFSGQFGYYLNVLSLRKMLKRGNYDLVNCHYVSGYGTLTRLTGVGPIVMSVFGSDVYEYPFKSRLNMRRIINNLSAARIITSTSGVMADKVKEYYTPREPIYVTYFGIDTDTFRPMPDVEKDKNHFSFGIVKKLEDKYGIDYLIRAFKLVLEEAEPTDRQRLIMRIYGFGSGEERYKELAKELGLNDKVIFGGFIKNELVPEIMNNLDVVCLPSTSDSESFGVAAVESMACGIPLITSNASGFTEVVEDGVCGFIVPKKDIRALADKMKEIFYMDEDKRKQMGLNGFRRASELFDFQQNIKTYISAIEKALK